MEAAAASGDMAKVQTALQRVQVLRQLKSGANAELPNQWHSSGQLPHSNPGPMAPQQQQQAAHYGMAPAADVRPLGPGAWDTASQASAGPSMIPNPAPMSAG